MEAHWIDSIGEVLLPRLQELGLHVDARTQLTVRQWLRTLEARATLPTDPAGLGHALRSIVCKTPRELALFDAQFDTWREPYTAGMTDQAAVPPARSWIEQAHDRVRSNRVAAAGQTRGRLRALVLAAILLCLVVAGVQLWPQHPGASAGVAPQPSTPIAHTLPQPSPAEVDEVYAVDADGRGACLFGLPSAVYLAIGIALLYLAWSASATERPSLYGGRGGGGDSDGELYADPLMLRSALRREILRSVARSLRRPRPINRSMLNLPQTVAASVRMGGLFFPVYRQEMMAPEYLVLVDRVGMDDQFAAYWIRVVKDLVHFGVSLSLFEFERDPRLVWAVGHKQNERTLGAQRLESIGGGRKAAGLIVVGDGGGLLDPLSGIQAPGVDAALSAWPKRVLLTPRAMASWGVAEQALARGTPAAAGAADGFLVAPAQIGWLAAAAAWLLTGRLIATDVVPGAPLFEPSALKEQGSACLSVSPPAIEDVRALVRQLRTFLGSQAHSWLVASALYPKVSIALTAYFANRLDDATRAADRRAGEADYRLREARLLAIANLPWFRHGLMSDWLRRALILSVGCETRQMLRGVLLELLETGDRSGAGIRSIHLGRVAGVAAIDIKRLRDIASTVEADDGKEAAPGVPPTGDGLDAICVGVLRGDFDVDLTLDAPEAYQRAIASPSGLRPTSNPVRWLVAAALALLTPLIWMKWLRDSIAMEKSADIVRRLTVEEPPLTVSERVRPILYPLQEEEEQRAVRVAGMLVAATLVALVVLGVFRPLLAL